MPETSASYFSTLRYGQFNNALQVTLLKHKCFFQNFDQLDPRVHVLDYEGFDFHANCPNFQSWNRLALLSDKIKLRLERYSGDLNSQHLNSQHLSSKLLLVCYSNARYHGSNSGLNTGR